MKGAGNLAKFIIEQGLERNSNGTDKRVLALLSSLARNPNNARHKRLLWRIIGPEIVKRTFLSDPFIPYPMQDNFEGEIEVGVVGICDEFKMEFKNAGTGNQTSSS